MLHCTLQLCLLKLSQRFIAGNLILPLAGPFPFVKMRQPGVLALIGSESEEPRVLDLLL